MKTKILILALYFIIPLLAKSQGPVYALNLSGDSKYIHVTDKSLLDLSTSGTLMAWVKVTTPVNYAGIFHKGDLPNISDEAYSLIIDNNRNFFFNTKKWVNI